MRFHAIGKEHKQKNHDLVDRHIDLAAVKDGWGKGGRSVSIRDTGLDAVEIKWIGDGDLGRGNYQYRLELSHADIARLFLEAFGEVTVREVTQYLATSEVAREKS